ncbi:hypothetical protein KUIN1_10770 [Pseudomonas sp. KUIN-1]|nr:hypothetical protein KUIN1_10770 [Pseudomonas sp. KUIN-1]
MLVSTPGAHGDIRVLKSPEYGTEIPLTIVPMLRVGMPFVTLCVTQQLCDVR